eukprot:m.106935 g.106935  ORF g.106935 m.106935 type:complete len:153 (-) comp15304_c0_seq68:2179-2637(-)
MLWSHSTNTNSRSNRNAAPTSMPHQWLWCWKALRGGINQGLTTSNYTTKTCTKVVTDPRIQTTPNTTIMYLLADVKVNTSYSLIVTMLNLKVEAVDPGVSVDGKQYMYNISSTYSLLRRSNEARASPLATHTLWELHVHGMLTTVSNIRVVA